MRAIKLGTGRRRVLLHVLLVLGLILGLVYVADVVRPWPASIIPLDVAPLHESEYSLDLQNGDTIHLTIPGDEDPWNARIRFHGAPGGSMNPQVGSVRLAGALSENEESAWYPFNLTMGTLALKAQADSGKFRVKFSYEEGKVPDLNVVLITSSGVVANATDSNEASGDRVVAYEFTVYYGDQETILTGPVTQAGNTFTQIPTTPGNYLVSARAKDVRGAWSVTLGRTFTVIGSLSSSGGVAGGVTQGDPSVRNPATDQNGNAILAQLTTGGGAHGVFKTMMYGWLRLLGCPGICHDPLSGNTLATKLLSPNARARIVEAFS